MIDSQAVIAQCYHEKREIDMAAKTGRGSDQFVLRLPDGMRDRIKAAAERNNRSMNAEIVATLEEKYPKPNVDFLYYLLDPISDAYAEASPDERKRILSGVLRTFRDSFDLAGPDVDEMIEGFDFTEKEIPIRFKVAEDE